MSTSPHNSSFPPLLLEKSLELSNYFAQKKTGNFKLEIKVGTSSYACSIDHSSGRQTGSPSQLVKPKKVRKKKYPSDKRRYYRRREKFLERKRSSSPPNPSNQSSTPSTDSPFIKESPQINNSDAISVNPSIDNPVIKESPQIHRNIDAMDIAEETAHVPVIKTRNKESDSSKMTKETIQPSSPTTPINEEVKLLICATNKTEASKISKNYPQAKYIGSHPSNKDQHFCFSTLINSTKLSELKKDVNKLEWPNVILFQVNKKNYQTDPKNHCQDCKIHKIY